MKKILLVVAVLAVLLVAGFGIKTAYDKKNENIVTTQPANGQDDAEAADENEVYYLTGQITEITDEYIILEGTEQGTVQVTCLMTRRSAESSRMSLWSESMRR